MKGLIIIPVFEEFDLLIDLLDKIPSEYDVLVIDDSGRGEFSYPGIRIIKNQKNLGKGASLRKGFSFALERIKMYDFIICMDADGEHPVKKLEEFKSKIQKNDIIFGQRKSNRSLLRNLMNKFSVFWINLIGIPLKDTSCGYFAMDINLLKRLYLESMGFDIDIEIILEAYKNKINYGTVMIEKIQYSKSSMGLSDYIIINNRFDKWVINNIRYLHNRLGLFRKIIIIICVNIGFFCGNLLLKFTSQKTRN